MTDATVGSSVPSPLLSVRHLVTTYETSRRTVRAVDDISFDVPRSSTVALVGESGTGKTTVALSILGLLPGRARVAGQVLFEGQDLLALDESMLGAIRGKRIAMVFRDPMTALDPARAVGTQITELAGLHRGLGRRAAKNVARDLLARLGFSSADHRELSLPQELSSGMLQRVSIALALACQPQLLVLDDPTAQLDPSTQAVVFDAIHQVQRQSSMGILLLTHDLNVVAEFATDVVVLYAGRVVESGPVEATFSDPLHPYTRALMASAPAFGALGSPATHQRLRQIEGQSPPSLDAEGCRFRRRCALRFSRPPGFERCDESEPDLFEAEDGRCVRCYYGGKAA